MQGLLARRPGARRRTTGALLVLALTFVLAACTPPFPGDDAFYRPPSPLPASEPGDVLSSRPSRFTLDPIAKTPVAGVTARQVLYRSTDALGQPMAVSGTVLVPDAPWTGGGSRPLVSYAVGTRGVGDDCAPSYTLSQGADYEGLFIKALLDRGWAVAVSDYQGLGTPGTHTYMVGPAQGHAVLDMARAALRLPDTDLSPSTPVGLMGYSQGGGAAGWAAELAGSYAPELDVRGAAVGGVPGDLTATAEFLDGSPFVAFALMAALGLDAAYPELDLESYLNDRGRALIERSQDLCLVSVDGFATLISVAFTRIDDYVTTNPLDTGAWRARLEESRLGRRAPAAPVYQYHAVVDEIVPYEQAADLRRTWCDGGGNVTWTALPLAEHALGLVQGQGPGAEWLADRFAGEPATSNCSRP
ncbi:MAG TPA: lipase family protein [Acidimicrobiales bacterium]